MKNKLLKSQKYKLLEAGLDKYEDPAKSAYLDLSQFS